MLILKYDPINGAVFPDALVESKAREIFNDYLAETNDWLCPVFKEVLVGSDMLITAFRVLIKRGEINHNEVVIAFNDARIRIDKFGTLETWPIGFADYGENFFSELLDWNKPDQ